MTASFIFRLRPRIQFFNRGPAHYEYYYLTKWCSLEPIIQMRHGLSECRSPVDRILPKHFLRRFHGRDIKIDNHRFLPRAHEHTFKRLIATGIDLLVRHVGRDIDKISGSSFRRILEPLAPAHAGPALDHEDDAFQVAVMMRAGLGIGV